MALYFANIIKKKRDRLELTSDEIQEVIAAYTAGEVPDYQMSALLMAIYLNGMNNAETVALVRSMIHSGVMVDTSKIKGFKVDKHSTGGVGDKTSLILGPVVAAAGFHVPMISGRGLGHTGGTLDKLESIPGFNTQQTLEKFVDITGKIGTCFIGQTKEICPADKKIYALRDVTGTIESFPLICASIMSKKIAEGVDGLVLDVKYGSGAFMKTFEQASNLAQALMNIAKSYDKKIVSLITSMQQPLGRFAGNSLEVFECVEIMKNKKFINSRGVDLYHETRELSLQLSAQMIHLSGQTRNVDEAYALAVQALESGKALKVFEEMCRLQGGNLAKLPMPQKSFEVKSTKTGFVDSFDTEKIGLSGILLHAGRMKNDDIIHPTAGIEFHTQLGDEVKTGDTLFTLHGDEPELFAEAASLLQTSYQISLQKPAPQALIKAVLN
ncbi:MAG: thymidine phosphorylase [Pseudobdellovibrio sp.]